MKIPPGIYTVRNNTATNNQTGETFDLAPELKAGLDIKNVTIQPDTKQKKVVAPTPWFHTVEVANKKATFVLRDNTGTPVGITHDEDIAKLITHAINTMPQLHINQIIKDQP